MMGNFCKTAAENSIFYIHYPINSTVVHTFNLKLTFLLISIRKILQLHDFNTLKILSEFSDHSQKCFAELTSSRATAVNKSTLRNSKYPQKLLSKAIELSIFLQN